MRDAKDKKEEYGATPFQIGMGLVIVGASAGMTLYTSQENQGNADANGTRPEKSRHEATETEIRSSDSTRMGQNA